MIKVTEQISAAIDELGYTPAEIRRLEPDEQEKTYRECLLHFVRSGDRRWWWEDFKVTAFSIDHLHQPYLHLEQYIPAATPKVWWMVEDDTETCYPIYECIPAVLKSLIGNCYSFEYYVIDPEMKWLICENHHEVLIGAGVFSDGF
ncbi:MAG: DUF6756 family protein [Saprospiraceae bacterium]|nr:DUF6756 family protein [Saprospiraceae bacterium]